MNQAAMFKRRKVSMVGWLLLVWIMVQSFAGSGCTPTIATQDPLRIPREELYSKIKTVAIDFGAAPSPVSLADLGKFEAIIEGRLREAGFAVVPSREAQGIGNRFVKQMGGLFDPKTGQRDEAKRKIVREHLFRELKLKFKADAVMTVNILPVSAEFTALGANWHGTSESILPADAGFAGLFFGPGVVSGTIQALSLLIVIEDTNEVPIYKNLGGIQLLEKFSGGKRLPVPREQVFSDEGRNREAVNIALRPLIEKTAQGAGAPGTSEATGAENREKGERR